MENKMPFLGNIKCRNLWKIDYHLHTAVNFLKIINKGLHQLHPGAMLIAEDSTAYPGVTKDVDLGGLGFDYKWDLGWMHDTLEYMKCHPYDRSSRRHLLTFSFQYAGNEHYLLPLSHDEVVHGKKLSFMGNELAMTREWDEKRELDWDLQKDPDHSDFLHYMTELNRVYLENNPLWEQDYTSRCMQWIDTISDDPRVFAFLRIGHSSRLLVLMNFADRSAALRTASIPISSSDKPVLLLDTGNAGEKEEEIALLPDSISPYTGRIIRLS